MKLRVKKKYDQTKDKATGRKMIPIQIFVLPETHAALRYRAIAEGRSLKYMMRRAAEALASDT